MTTRAVAGMMIALCVVGAAAIAVSTAAAGGEPRPARPPKEKLLVTGRDGSTEVPEGRRVILDQDSFPREPAKLTAGPTVTKKDGGFAIAFALDRPDDVLVRIVDAEGRTVRNLVSGVLGRNAPEPLEADRLEQEILWDGKDAKGNPAPPGCRVRVAVGVTPRFDRFVAHDPPQILSGVCALEVDLEGRVYVGLVTDRSDDNHMARYDREGSFLEMVYPPNPRTLTEPLEKVIRRVDYLDGTAMPKRREGFEGDFMFKPKWKDGQFAKTVMDPIYFRFPLRIARDGKAYVLASSYGDNRYGAWWDRSEEEALGIANLTGGNSSGGHMRFVSVSLDPFWWLDYTGGDTGHWALGLDGCVYAVRNNAPRMATQVCKMTMNPLKAANDFEYNGEEKLAGKRWFLGTKERTRVKPEDMLFNMIVDLAVDEEGYLYVADARTRDMDHITGSPLEIIAPNGKTAATLTELELAGRKTPLGDVFGVRVTAGALYVVTRLEPERNARDNSITRWKKGQVVKFARSAGGALSAVWAAPVDPSAHLVAVDEAVEPPIVWVGNGNGPATFTRIVDLGDKPGEVRHCGTGIRKGVLVEPWALAVDARGRVYTYDHARGTIVRTNDDGTDWTESAPVGPTRMTLHMDRPRNVLWAAFGAYSNKVYRYDADLGTRADLMRTGGSATLGAADGQGRIYVGDWGGGQKNRTGVVSRYGPDGTLIEKDLCTLSSLPGSVAMDSKECLYVTDVLSGAPIWDKRTEWRRGEKPVDSASDVSYLVKFPPEGGARFGDTELWAHLGVSPVYFRYCACTAATFKTVAVDDADRVYATDYVHCHVKMLDTAGNLITRVGGWGNAEFRGPDSTCPEPEIAFWWVHSIDALGDYLYASDRSLGRIVKVRMDYRETKEAAVP